MLYSDACAFIPFEEEPDMTLQVALIGTDGFVIASDTKAVSGGGIAAPFSKKHRLRMFSETTKIIHNDADTLVCAFSGNQTIREIARRLRDAVGEDAGQDLAAQLQNKIDAAFAACSDTVRNNANGLIIVIIPNAENGMPKMWEISFHGQPLVEPTHICSIGGDRSNSAIMWAQQYQIEGLKRSVDELKLLAAHTVVEGHFLNATEVDGLDVFVAKNGEKPRFLENDELQSLWDRSEVLRDKLAAEVYNTLGSICGNGIKTI